MSGVWRMITTMQEMFSRGWPLCSRPTRSGTPCRRGRLRAVTLVLDGQVERYETPACDSHATDAELIEHAYAEALAENAHREYHKNLPVECWSWPVTGDHRKRAAEANACLDSEEAYGLAWQLLEDWQAKRCAICGGRSKVDDHDHQTGLVRGRLCQSCNTLEAFAYLPGNPFERYRARNPASILGLTIRYYSPITGWAEPESPPRDPWENHPMRGVGL